MHSDEYAAPVTELQETALRCHVGSSSKFCKAIEQ